MNDLPSLSCGPNLPSARTHPKDHNLDRSLTTSAIVLEKKILRESIGGKALAVLADVEFGSDINNLTAVNPDLISYSILGIGFVLPRNRLSEKNQSMLIEEATQLAGPKLLASIV
jgi:hypothetical protein